MITAIKDTEPKVKAATTGALVGAAVGRLACWLADSYVFTPRVEGDLPPAVTEVVMMLAAAAVAWAAGYMKRNRPS